MKTCEKKFKIVSFYKQIGLPKKTIWTWIKSSNMGIILQQLGNHGLLNQLFMVKAKGMEIYLVGEDQTQCMVGLVLKLFEKHESCRLKRKKQEI
jgi:hypothetical protein